MRNRTIPALTILIPVLVAAGPVLGQSSSLIAGASSDVPRQPVTDPGAIGAGANTARPGLSMFAVDPPDPIVFVEHDLIQIIIRESTSLQKTADFDTEKDYNLKGKISAWPDMRLEDLLQLQLFAGRATDLPEVKVNGTHEFEAEGEKKETEDLAARLTSEVIEVLPNGNLILEARTEIILDSEISVIKVTGMCNPNDVTPNRSILSNQIHDLKIERLTQGDLKRNAQKGLLTRFFETIFPF